MADRGLLSLVNLEALQASRLSPDSGIKTRLYNAVEDAHMAHLIKVDLKAELFSDSIDEYKKR